MKQTTIVFDAETAPLAPEILEERVPEFEADSRLVDPVKIRASIAAKKQEWLDKAALNALTGQVLCIGLSVDGEFRTLSGLEPDVLRGFFETISTAKEHASGALQIVGYNSHIFDLPMICRRSWLLGVRVPSWIRRGRYWSELFVDLREQWMCGDRVPDRTKTEGLNGLCKAFGIGEKSGDGKYFGKLWESDRVAALAYLRNDILLTQRLAEKMNIITTRNKEQDELPL